MYDLNHFCCKYFYNETLCEIGHWCREGKKVMCPAGSYGKDEGLSSSRCSGYCLPGYYCEKGSSVNDQHQCGSTKVYCPLGSASPTPTETGKYSYNSTADDKDETTTSYHFSWQRECEQGYYCVNGVKLQCPEGTYNNGTGMSDINHCKPCDEGKKQSFRI